MNFVTNAFESPKEGELNIFIRILEETVEINMDRTISYAIGDSPDLHSTDILDFQRSMNWFQLLEKFYQFFIDEFEKQIATPEGVPNFKGDPWNEAIGKLVNLRKETRKTLLETAHMGRFMEELEYLDLGETIDGKKTRQSYWTWLKSYWPF